MEMKTFKNEMLNCSVTCVSVEGAIWFKGRDVASILGYVNTNLTIQLNVELEDKQTFEELRGINIYPGTPNENNTIYINESGLYSLIMSSKKPEAKQFKHWVTSEVLTSIREYGTYTVPSIVPQISIMNEKDLHFKVIAFIKKYLPDAIIVPGLGENQTTPHLRYESKLKGYISGTPDILILNKHVQYSGLAIELKTPNGKGILSDNQELFLNKLNNNNFKTVIANDYDEVIVLLLEYFKGICYKCNECRASCKSRESLENHIKRIHK
jgi:prophage antirepressor-like protein